MSEKPIGKIKLKIPAGSATMGGTIAPALGQKGVKAKDFVDQFNEQTKHLPKGLEIHTTIYVMKNKSFTFKFNTESAVDMLKKALNIKKGSGKTGIENVATISMSQVEELAQKKIDDTSTDQLENMKKTIIGTAKSMGIKVQ